MGIRDLLLRKGRGAGELKSFKTERTLNFNIRRIIINLGALDVKANSLRKNNNLGGLFNCIKEQMSLLEQVHHFALVRTIRLQYDYKEIEKKLVEFESHYRNEVKKLKIEEIKLMKRLRKGEIIQNPEHIKKQISDTRKKLSDFDERIRNMKKSLRGFKKDIQDKCKKKIIKIKKIYHFT